MGSPKVRRDCIENQRFSVCLFVATGIFIRMILLLVIIMKILDFDFFFNGSTVVT